MADAARVVHNRFRTSNEVVGFYTPHDAARLARIPRQRLDAWRRMGVIPRDFIFIGYAGKEDEGYSFQSLIYLRVLRMLRSYESLQCAVDTVKHLVERFGEPGPAWADARLLKQGWRVYAIARDKWEVTDTQRGQKAMYQLLFDEDFEQLRKRADALLVPRKFQDYIQINPSVASGMPILQGTRMPTGAIYALHNRKFNQREIIREYPSLTQAQVKKAIDFEHLLDYAPKISEVSN
jgi:uncharacterized protein (DUF433 family)